LHVVMYSVACRGNAELAAKSATEAEASRAAGLPTLLDRQHRVPSIVEDGGLFKIGDHNDVLVYRSSGTFGRAEEAGRLCTANLFQQVLGETITVETGIGT
jgi:hypothetical protein